MYTVQLINLIYSVQIIKMLHMYFHRFGESWASQDVQWQVCTPRSLGILGSATILGTSGKNVIWHYQFTALLQYLIYPLNQEPGGPETCTIRHFKAFFMPYNQFAYSKGLWPFVCPCSRYTWLQIIKIVQICGSVLHYKSGTRWSRDMYNTSF